MKLFLASLSRPHLLERLPFHMTLMLPLSYEYVSLALYNEIVAQTSIQEGSLAAIMRYFNPAVVDLDIVSDSD